MHKAVDLRRGRRTLGLGAALGALSFLLAVPALPPGEEAALLSPPPTAAAVSAAPAGRDGEITLRLLERDGTVTRVTLEDYLWRVVAAEMPASFEPEALKAQAVCARTYTLWKMSAGLHGEQADLCADPACCQACTDRAAAEERWGAGSGEFGEKISRAVAETDGMVLTYEGELIQAVFFSSAAGTTESAAAVWGSEVPYLVSVDSPEGGEVPDYRTTVSLTRVQLRELADRAGARLDESGGGWITDVQYTAAGRVARLRFGDITLSGGAARSLFGLRSACFTVTETEEGCLFAVTGYGHGVGMSQYGANAMAAAGHTWREIVTHYYTGVTVEHL